MSHAHHHAHSGHSGHNGHNHAEHGGEDIDWEALSADLERQAELHLPFLDEAAAWLRQLRREDHADRGTVAEVGRVLDVGSGPGVATCVLARAFPRAEVVAVDQATGLLERSRARAAEQGLEEGRVVSQQAELPDDLGALPPADVIWTSQTIHHVGDQQAALNALATSLRPCGLLAVVEQGLPLRYLPRDIGVGRPGLQTRLDAAWEDTFTAMREELPGSASTVEDWPAMLAGAGLVPTGTRTFLTDHPAPLGTSAREHLHDRLTRLRERVGDQLEDGDRLALDQLLDTDSPAGILWRPDAFYLSATTVHTAHVQPTD